MYLAELRGKFSPSMERMEDILTCNVFSFFKYSSRNIFLRGYLSDLGCEVSEQEASEAEFMFWPRFEDNTEPDLVLIVGDYYLLIEAKYYSGFADETPKTKAQLQREINGGRREAKNYGKQFYLVAITADSYRKEDKFKAIPSDQKPYCIWTNWQRVSRFLYDILESDVCLKQEERDFALDLYSLLDKKNLRGFQGVEGLGRKKTSLKTYASIFFDARTAKFRGDFIGFINSLWFDRRIISFKTPLFFGSNKKLFEYQLQGKKLKHIETTIFYEEGSDHGQQE
jgi:hypothetical protein